ncbi:MAG TPA: methyltransferase domain-containing protein [Stellaceae bacterium]|nr:methyltransferase domain-containing protein [Stellaceae bacterium]
MTTTTFSRDFTRRSNEPEWLDGADLDGEELAAVLRDLASFNRTMLGHYPILNWLGRAIRDLRPERPLNLIDAGCGYGDLLRAIRRWADRRGLEVALLGLDSNKQTIRIARAATDPRERIDFAVADALHFRPAAPVDLIVNSLLAHHLRDTEIVDLLRWMEATARCGWLVCDLQRHPLPYHAIGVAGRLSRLHRTVIHDGQISVMRALSRAEWNAALAAAGIPRRAATVRSFLFRWLIGRQR